MDQNVLKYIQGSTPLENYNYGFGSNAANLEYSILSNMLGSPITDSTSISPLQATDDVLKTIWSQQQQQSTNVNNNNSNNNGIAYLSSPNNMDSNSTLSFNNTNEKGNIASVSSSTMGTSEISASGISTLSAYGDGAVVAKVASPVTASTGPSVKRRNQVITPQMVYACAIKPFSYAEGYHYLINYVKSR